MKFLHSQQILPLLDHTSGGEFPAFFLPLAECCVRWRPTEASAQSGFSPKAATHPHTHSKASLVLDTNPFPVHYHIPCFQSAEKRRNRKLCEMRDHGTVAQLGLSLSSSINTHHTNNGRTWEQFVYFCFICKANIHSLSR